MNYNCHKASGRALWLVCVFSFAFLSIAFRAESSQSVSLEWDPSADADVTGYRLWYGTSAGAYQQSVEVGNTTSATLPNLADDQTYFIVVTAFNAAGLESEPSNEVSFTTDAPTPVDPTPVDPTPVDPTPVDPTPVDPTPVDPTPVDPAPVDPTPEDPAPDEPTSEEVVLTSPSQSGQLNGPADIVLTASAILSEAVERVEFYAGDVKVAEATSAPYEAVWNRVEPGCYEISVVAKGTGGKSLRSSAVEIEVVPLRTGRMDILDDGTFEVEVQGAAGSVQTIWVSEDLKNWTPLATTTNVTGSCTVRDPQAKGKKQRFYKVTDGEM